ncbi:aldehyde dehydrogenase family protein [Longimicrobium sp.]|uniref:aldehyde dehydrogenase family protein n=1 Tax=Longimicrobium sp. TaxID=2029185 RepID=UPI002C59F168|nr:aldehyde dehydrogenase family protein [Longimicrobium sp.]HSU17304.1 aldehyde dehydrogenase family protein [Longimicrobium sp.]
MSIAEIFETLEYGPAPESASPATRWLDDHDRTTRMYIGGEWRGPGEGEYFDTVNPANNKPLARVAQAGKADVDAAVAAARGALEGWQALGGHGRARYLYAIARQVQKHSRLFAVLESMDNGKPIRESRDIDIPLVARHFYHHAGWAQLMETDPELRDCGALGVVGQIIPWNFPLLMLSWKIAPALAMGNTVVLKPAEFTPLTAILFAEICDEAGLPPGVVNIITGDGRTGALLVEHPDVDKVAFTGSTEVGRIIRVATAGSGKKLSLELGGKSPFIVFDDADIDSVVEGVVDAIWFNQGQVCCAGSRILAQEGISRKLTEKLRARMETLRVGDPLDKSVDIGAIVAPVQLQKIQQLVQQGVEEGATMWQPSWSCPQEGCFFPPTLFTDVSPSSTIAQVEIFGPVVVSMTFRTPGEAVELANNTPYGLAASVWTENINLALDIAPKVKAGTVWVNSTNVFDAASGFGGYRESGYGREGGREGLYEYVKAKWEKEMGKAKGDASQQTKTKAAKADAAAKTKGPTLPPIDRTAKLYVGGKQARPDSGYSMPVHGAGGRLIAEVGLGNRKDVRNAVEAAHKAAGWGKQTGHNRAQVLYYLAENLAARTDEFARRIATLTGDEAGAAREVDATIRRLYVYAAWADKYDGDVHATPVRMVTLAMKEPIGVIGAACPDEAPLLGFVSLVAPAIAMGNSVVVIPSERWPLAATDFYQVLDTSDVPGGVVNIVTGKRDELAQTLAAHDDVDAMWYFGGAEGSEMVERLSAGNMKRTFVGYGRPRDWFDPAQGEGAEFLRQATNVKNIWVPYGE